MYRIVLSAVLALTLGAAAFATTAGDASAAARGPELDTRASVLHQNRADCRAIRGTDYWSDEERAWFLTYCVDRAAAPPEPVYVIVAPPAPVFQPAPASVASRGPAPGVTIACYSSQGAAVAEGDLQNVPLNAFPGEAVSCTASVAGSYSSIDWAGGQYNGSGPSFVTSFSFRTTPWTIRAQVNWGGNPVIKYVSVTTTSGCPGYFSTAFCYVR
jgi:hypothetical protein